MAQAKAYSTTSANIPAVIPPTGAVIAFRKGVSATTAHKKVNSDTKKRAKKKTTKAADSDSNIERLIQEHNSAWLSWSHWLLKCEAYPFDICREFPRVTVGNRLDNGQRTPIIVNTHEEIDAFMAPNPCIFLSAENQRQAEERLAAKHKELDDDAAALALRKEESGFAVVEAKRENAHARVLRAIRALAKAKPRTLHEVAKIARYFRNRERNETLPDGVLPAWLNTLTSLG